MGWDPLPSAVIYYRSFHDKLEPLLKTQKAIDMLDYGCLEGDWWHFRPFDACLVETQTIQFIRDLSREQDVPLLYYFNVEDYGGCDELDSGKEYPCDIEGWGYRLFVQGEVVARAFFDYQVSTWGEAFAQHIGEATRDAHPGAFSKLGLGAESVRQIKALLTPEALIKRMDTDDLMDIATEFQALLGINSAFRH